MGRTIYKVEAGSSGKPVEGAQQQAPVAEWEPTAASRIKRRRLIYVLAGIVFLTVVMIAIIAVLSTSESPAKGALPSSSASTVGGSSFSPEPVGTSTTAASAAMPTAAPPKTGSPTSSPSLTAAAQPTSTTYATHPINRPVRVVIPALGVDAKVIAVGVTSDTSMEIPPVGIVGWYKLGVVPGGAGPSVLVSHVSWKGKKGAFYKLKELKPGDEVEVYDVDGSVAVFQVDSSETILKTQLPTERIWNDTSMPVIRLVTCGGEYNASAGHYSSNVIVYGHLVS